jgi:hypothetical protein
VNKPATQRSPGLWLWPIALTIIGVLLLLHNYFLLEFNILQLWPLLLVVLGLQVLLRGDFGISWAGHTFGITRGSVEAGTLRANSGELDLRLGVLEREGRLIAGQYTARSRPQLVADGSRAILTMLRGNTWLLSMADWELGLAGDLPWRLLLSSYLGEIDADLRGLIVDEAIIASGFGNIHVVGPDSPAGPIAVRSTLGDITLNIPEHMAASVTVNGSAFFGVKLLSNRWEETGPNSYQTINYAGADDPLTITVTGTFGDLTLH